MGFRTNFSEAQNGNLKPEGEYECLIAKIEEKQTQSGKMYINVSFVIRNDVNQAYKNGYIFHSIGQAREPSAADNQVNGYQFGRVMALAQAAQLQDGKDYANLAEFFADLVKKPVRVKLIHDTWNDKTREAVDTLSPTAFPEVRHVPKTNSVNNNVYAPAPSRVYNPPAAAQALPIEDEDLPF